MKTIQSSPNFAIGQVLGTVAFKSGKKKIPAHDSELMSQISANALGDNKTIQILKGWLFGWDNANINEYINL